MISKSTLIGATAAAAVVARAQDCDCYLIDGSSPTHYKNYGFWDFRSLSEFAGEPPVLETVEENLNADYSSAYFADGGEFQSFWGPQKWDNGGEFVNQNSFNNLYIAENPDGDSETLLRMRTARGSNFQSSAEFESLELADHASMRMYARTYGDSGACTAMFTYLDADEPANVQESDIEILTKDPEDLIHYTNQPGVLDGESVPGASNEINMPSGQKWSQWLTHRLDWTPGNTVWSVNGKETHAQELQTPTDPSTLTFNAWSDGGVWTGEMAEGGAAYQDIQWIEIAYNVVDAGSCSNVCNVGNTPGSPGTGGSSGNTGNTGNTGNAENTEDAENAENAENPGNAQNPATAGPPSPATTPLEQGNVNAVVGNPPVEQEQSEDVIETDQQGQGSIKRPLCKL